MSGINGDQLHRSTLGIYSNLTDEFNPSLLNLVSLGNSYAQAFKALAVCSEAYFNALSKIGEKAFDTAASRSLGDVLIQLSENQKRLTLELEGVFRWFSTEVLQVMENNVRLDKGYISDSRVKYEREVHNQAAARARQRSRGTSKDGSGFVHFLRESYQEALGEEERRYRFLAEKHCGLVHFIAHLMNKTGGTLQHKADSWTEAIGATRRPEVKRPPSVENTVGMRAEDQRQIREALGKIPSRAPSPQGSISLSRGDSGGIMMRARVAHQPAGFNPTLLPFSRGAIITVLVRQPRNGWLYGCAEGSSSQGWFPAAYVEPVSDPPAPTSSRTSTLRSSSSMSSLLDQPKIRNSSSSSMNSMLDQPKIRTSRTSSHSSSSSRAPPPPPPPPLQSSSKAQSELFPRVSNPFATVKLKPTSTNDRSAPHIQRR
ncbi:brain-specific angiogenesis inhibitor 1-associated protein 2-like protein 2 [Kryptolebias marmoratus]|uniref:BAR/IMD domain containing adaptor protein 2 like 2a n=1 Tax=Kryptolebias marmoratus TaxID=37003 RepID=A0A3Q3B0L9_KRYMA|nr:brain-specific angiogenesis inhibitor 1-associated protein 2-like protein 2 [Kryptolebias marmoratus]